MANYVCIDPTIGVVPMTQTGTFATSAGVYPPFPFGIEVRAKDNQTGSGNLGGAVFRFCQGSDVGTSGLVVYISNNSAIKLGGGQPGAVGVAAGVMSATNQYGWVQIQGYVDYGRGTNVPLTAGNPLFVGTAAGFLVSGSVANSGIKNMVAAANYNTTNSLSMSLYLERPYCAYNTASN